MSDLDDMINAIAAKARPSAASRREELVEAVRDMSVQDMIAIADLAYDTVMRIPKNRLDPTEDVLSDDKLEGLMEEEVGHKTLKEFLECRYVDRRHAILRHIESVCADTGEAVVGSLKKKFVRQGGRLKSQLLEDELRARLTSEHASTVFREVVVPEHVEYRLDEAALVRLVADHPDVMEIVKECVVDGKRTPVSLHVRDM